MSRKTIELNGVDFEYMGESTDIAMTGSCYVRHDIFDAYSRPSIYKQRIWRSWCDWAEEIDDVTENYAWIEISSHNCMNFSIRGQVYINNAPYKVWITKCHNRAWRLNA